MEIRALCLTFVVIGLAFAFSAVFVESQHVVSESSTPPPPISKESSIWPPPPPPPHYKMETQSYQGPPPPPPISGKSKSLGSEEHRRRHRKPHLRRRNEHKMNKGKMIGFIFAGVAAVLQAGVIGFLVFQRKQLMRLNQR
ncbi:hypothetical protein LINPERPRIM_LOCUS1310 [Linum perenne]